MLGSVRGAARTRKDEGRSLPRLPMFLTGLIVKMDDVGLRLAQERDGAAASLGRALGSVPPSRDAAGRDDTITGIGRTFLALVTAGAHGRCRCLQHGDHGLAGRRLLDAG